MRKIIIIMAIFCGFVLNSANADDLTLQCKDPSKCTVDEMVVILNLPEEPDEELNNSTLLGVDADGSIPLVRDDIERKIGITFFTNSQARGIYNRQAELWSLILINKGKPEVLKYIDEYRVNMNCKTNNYVRDFNGKTLELLHGNTEERFFGIAKKIADSGYKYYHIDNAKVKTYCESFN